MSFGDPGDCTSSAEYCCWKSVYWYIFTTLHLLKKCLKTNIANKLLQLKLMVQYFSASTAIEVTSMIDNDIIFGAYDPSQVRLSEVPLMSYRHYLNTSSWPQFLFSLHMKLYDSHLSVTEVEQVIY